MASCCCGESSSCYTVCRISQCSMEQINPDYPSVFSPTNQILRLASSANIIEMPFDRLSLRFYHQMLQEYFVARQPIKRNPSDLADVWSLPCLNGNHLSLIQICCHHPPNWVERDCYIVVSVK